MLYLRYNIEDYIAHYLLFRYSFLCFRVMNSEEMAAVYRHFLFLFLLFFFFLTILT